MTPKKTPRPVTVGGIELRDGLENMLRPVDSVRHYPRNPRRGNVAAIRASLESHGMYRPLVVQASTGYILAGNHLFDALTSGDDPATEVPCVVVDVDDAHAKKIVLADNRTSDLGTYDEEVLAELLREADATTSRLTGTGYDSGDLDRLIASLPVDDVPDLDDAPPLATEPAKPTSQPGDVWLLGDHRVMCGSSASDADVATLLGDDVEVDMVFTDPPYGVAYVGRTGDALTIQNDEDDDEALSALLDAAFGNIRKRLRPGGVFYICTPTGSKAVLFWSALSRAGLKLRQALTWVKQAFVFGRRDYHWKHEGILYGWADGETPAGPLPLYDPEHETMVYGWKEGADHTWNGGRKQTTVWEHPKPAASRIHPTMKPISLVARALLNSSSTGDTVLDLFGGSGSTVIACEKEHRRARVMELDPRYVDVICSRWEAMTGKSATLETTGARFTPPADALAPPIDNTNTAETTTD